MQKSEVPPEDVQAAKEEEKTTTRIMIFNISCIALATCLIYLFTPWHKLKELRLHEWGVRQ